MIPFVSDVCRSPTSVVLAPQNVVARLIVSWTPPIENTIKINVDDSFSSVGVGGIGRCFKRSFRCHSSPFCEVG